MIVYRDILLNNCKFQAGNIVFQNLDLSLNQYLNH